MPMLALGRLYAVTNAGDGTRRTLSTQQDGAAPELLLKIAHVMIDMRESAHQQSL